MNTNKVQVNSSATGVTWLSILDEEDGLHRIDGPAAVEHSKWDGITLREWLIHHERHRLNGPAHVSTRPTTTSLQWWTEGELHRVDGPAYVYCDGAISWYIDTNSNPVAEVFEVPS